METNDVINITLVKDNKVGGYTIHSKNVFKDKTKEELIIAEGETILDALNQFENTLYDIIKFYEKD